MRAKVSDGKLLIKREAGLRSRWSDMRANALPDNTSLAEQQVIKAFDNWSRDSGAEITSIMPQWKNDSTNYMTLNCRVEASGTLGTLSQFLYNIEKGPMALKLDSVELSAHDNTGQQLTLGLQISGLALIPQTTIMKPTQYKKLAGAGAGAGERLFRRRAIERRARPDGLRAVQPVHHRAEHF